MRREIMLPAALAALMCAMLAGGAWLILAPSPATWLLPAGTVVTRVDPVGAGRQRIAARLGDRQNRYDVYDHLIHSGWSQRRINVIREDTDQVYYRRGLGGYALEVAVVVQADDDRHTITILYQRCFRRLTCGLR